MESSKTDLYLSLGSNLGNRRGNIDTALELLKKAIGAPPEAVSSIIETEPQGFSSPNKFLNCCARFGVPEGLGPIDILHICKDIERRLGRVNDGLVYDGAGARIYRDRPIDIDILYFGDVSIDTPELTIPHPRMAERDFVMRPLREIFRLRSK